MLRIIVLLCVLLASSVQAQPPLPADQWDAGTQLWLARAAVAEAGWNETGTFKDHKAIPWVLVRRWQSALRKYPNLRFVDKVRNYCSALGENDTFTRRQQWVRNLPPMGDDTQPEAWPSMYSWQKHLKYWRAVQQTILSWGEGKVRDPSGGRAWHWGSPSPELPDVYRAQGAINDNRWVLLNIGETQNSFYGHVRGVARPAR